MKKIHEETVIYCGVSQLLCHLAKNQILLELHINLTFTIQHCHDSLSNNKTTIEANLEPFFVAQWLAILTNGAMWCYGCNAINQL